MRQNGLADLEGTQTSIFTHKHIVFRFSNTGPAHLLIKLISKSQGQCRDEKSIVQSIYEIVQKQKRSCTLQAHKLRRYDSTEDQSRFKAVQSGQSGLKRFTAGSKRFKAAGYSYSAPHACLKRSIYQVDSKTLLCAQIVRGNTSIVRKINVFKLLIALFV